MNIYVGDEVECLNAEAPPGTRVDLTEGRRYRVVAMEITEEEAYGFPAISTDVVVIDDAGDRFGYDRTRFCAPGESRVELRRRIAELEAFAADARIDVAAARMDREQALVRADKMTARVAELEKEREGARVTFADLFAAQTECDRQIAMREETERALVKARAQVADANTCSFKYAGKAVGVRNALRDMLDSLDAMDAKCKAARALVGK